MPGPRFAGKLDARSRAADVVAEALRDAILGGEVKDGERLNQGEIADEFGISRVPVREAIGRLQAEGLVSAEPHKKAVVIGFDQHRMAEVFEIRALLEPHALATATPSLDASTLSRLRQLCEQSERCDDPSQWLGLHSEFHRQLLAASESRITLSVIEHLSGQVERYLLSSKVGTSRDAIPPERRVILDAFQDPGYRRETDAEHRELLNALASGDHREAIEMLRLHILSTRHRLLVAVADQDGDLATDPPAGRGESSLGPQAPG
jgi:DNA-binding GntR family transcriptional regulator